MTHSLSSLKGLIQELYGGSIIWVIEVDTRISDYSSRVGGGTDKWF